MNVRDIHATFRTRCGCTQQVWLRQATGVPSFWQLPLKDPVEVKVDAEPRLEMTARTFKLMSARETVWGIVEAEYLEVL